MSAPISRRDLQIDLPLSIGRLNAGALIAAAGLVGFGVILWLAANWDAFGRFGRFGLVGGLLAVSALGAAAAERLRPPLLLLAFAAVGGLLALIGQTYQTGADAWQLFALWAVLTLPWALAARSDAIWTPWVVVVMTALSLWQTTMATAGALGPFGSAASLSLPIMIAGWGAALALVAALSPDIAIFDGLGRRRWAYRVAMLLTIANIASFSITATFLGNSGRADIVILGLAALGAMGVWVAQRRPQDALLLSAAALAIDAVLIAATSRMLLSGSGTGSGSFITIGITAAMIVAGSVMAVLALIDTDARPSIDQRLGTGDARRFSTRGSRPWPVVALSGLGAFLATIPFLVAIALIFGSILHRGPSIYVVGLLIGVTGFVMMRQARTLFVEQIATIAFAVGYALFAFAHFRDLPVTPAALMLGVSALGLALACGKPWAAALLGAISAGGFAVAIAHGMASPSLRTVTPSLTLAWALIVAAWGAAMVAVDRIRQELSDLHLSETVDAMLYGIVAATLLGLSIGSGPTFLVSATIGMGSGLNQAMAATMFSSIATRVLGIALAAGAAAVLMRHSTTLRTPIGLTTLSIMVALSAVMPGLGAASLVLALSAVRERRALAIAAAVAGLWIAGSFYYNLALPLTTKAMILLAAGIVLGTVAWITGSRLERITDLIALEPRTRESLYAPGLVLVGLVAALAISSQTIVANEHLIANGERVFVELGPRDPRSLMQGDFMALRFNLPTEAMRHQPRNGEPPYAAGKRDDRGVVRLTRIVSQSTPIEPDEVRMALTLKNGRWIVVTDAWFFEEGTAKRWEAARFGEFRLLPDGRALLVGLADQNLTAIK